MVVNVDILRWGRTVERTRQEITDLIGLSGQISDVTGKLTDFLDPVVFDWRMKL